MQAFRGAANLRVEALFMGSAARVRMGFIRHRKTQVRGLQSENRDMNVVLSEPVFMVILVLCVGIGFLIGYLYK